MFTKKLADLTKTDIEHVVVQGIQEGSQVEFKSALSANKGEHPWYAGKDEIGDKARDKITKELIAFANAHGGTLVLGIKETDEKPARAAEIKPIPRAAELAERLRQACSDCIDPRLPVLEAEGIPIEEDDSGVVVFHVPHSRLAPHRHKSNKECYYRRADRSEAMTMREIQDLTLFTERGMVAVDRALGNQRDKFDTWFKKFIDTAQDDGHHRAFGIRITAYPTTPIQVEKVHKEETLSPPLRGVPYTLNGGEISKLASWRTGCDWRPILRGTVQSKDCNNSHASREVHYDGLIEYQLALSSGPEEAQFSMSPDLLLGLVSNTILAIEKFRINAGAPGVEYALDVAIDVVGSPIPVMGYGNYPSTLGCTGGIIFPRYSVGSPSEFQSLGSLVERDYWNHVGQDRKENIKIDFDTALQELGLSLGQEEDAATDK